MKKFLLSVVIVLIIKFLLYMIYAHYIEPLTLYFSNSYYTYKLMHYNYSKYLPLEDKLLTSITQKKQPFDENLQKIMTKTVYDTLYHKFQYAYKPEPIIYVKIIDQRIDTNNPNLIYIDFLFIQPLKHQKKYTANYRFTFDQIIAQRNTDNSWQLIYYEEPTKYTPDRVFFSYWSNLEYNYTNELNYKIFVELDKIYLAYQGSNFKNMYFHFSNIINFLYDYKQYYEEKSSRKNIS